MCIFVAYYIAETNTINIFTNKTKTIMKYKHLRFSLLSVLVMLFSGLVYAAATDNPYKHIFSTTEKTFTTDETQNLSGVDWTLTTTWFDNSKKDYNKDADWGMKLGSNSKPIQSLTLTSKEGDIPGTITSVKVSGKIRSGAAVNMSVTVGGVAFTPADAAMSKDGSELEFTGSGTGSVVITCNTTSAANKSGAIYIRDITIAYENGGQTDTRVATSITLVNPTTTAAVGDVVALPSAELKAADESNITDAVITWESSDETVAAFVDNAETGMKELKALKAGTATITASYAGNTTYKASSASFTLTVKEYTQYTTIASMLENITSTKTDIKYTFSGIAVTYVNGKYTYIYKSGDGVILLYGDNLGLEAGCVYNGSLVGQLYAFNGLPEIAVSANDINVEKQEGMVEVSINIITPDELPYYINKQCAIQNAEYVSTASGNMTFTVGDKEFIVRNSFGIDLPELTAGKKYTVEGFGAVYVKNDNTTYQLYPTNVTEEQETPAGFRDIKIDLTQHSELLTESDVYITVAEDGTIGTTDNAENAAATIKGKVHGSYGSANFTASVPVQGCVKITYATHDYGNDIIVTNSEGAEVAKLNTMGDKWMSNHDNVAVTYYRTNEPTTLNFSKANYNPYFAVEAIDPADLPAEVTSYNITFAAGEGVTGTVPAALEVEAGGKFTAPKNYTLYKEGYTLNGWESGDAIYLPGQEVTPEADMTLTAHFAQNEVSLADRTETVAIDFTLNGTTGQYKFEGNTGFMVTQATVNGKTIDVKADINATGGKFAYNGSGWHQVNQGTKVTVPSAKGAIIKVATYNNATSVTFNGEAGTADENTAVFTAATETATVEIAQVASNYWNSLSIVLPIEEKEQKLYIAGNNTSTGWCTDNPDEMTFNAETQKFEYVMDFNGATYFTITTGKTETPDDWETFGTYRLGIGAGDQDVTTDTEYQLANYSNGTFVLQGNGKYLISVTSDLKMTITQIEPVYVVAGWLMESQEAGFFGEAWNTTLEANQMEKQEDGTYKKVWNNVELPVGTIEYKIVKDGNTWIPSGDNLSYSITEAGTYNVIVTFNPQTEEASMIVEAAVEKDITGTWDYSDPDVMAATMALSGSNEAGEVNSIENTLKMTVVANGAAFRNNGNNIQVRSGAEFRIPVRAAGDIVTIMGYPGYSYYKINGGDEITNTNDNPQTEYKAKASDAERGYVSVVSTNDNNYFLSLSVVQYAKKEKITLDNEPATATFPFNEGTEGQKAEFSNADYFLSSKVTVGSNWFIKDKTTYADTEETRLEPVAKHDTDLTDDDAVRFLITPKPGFTFKPTKVGFKANRFGTDNGKIDAYWQYSDGTTIELETGIKPERNNSGVNTVKSYDIEGGTAAEGTCGLKLFLYNLQEGKQIGLADIVIEGILNGTEKDVPVLASFKINSKEYAVEDVFGEQYEATLELPKAETMVSANNPLTDVTAKSGEVGTITYEEKENACTVTIPMTADETTMNYVLNVTFKPDFTLSYLDVEGNVLGTQAVEKDATIGAFAYDIADVTATKDGYKARGWFKQAVLGEKFTTADVITADTKLYAIQTEMEVPSTHKKYFFDLADKNFYAEDHEAFNPAGEGYYWHDAQHGWAFKNGNTVDLLVGPKATITVTLCQYGSGTGIAVKKGDQTLATLDGKSEGDGGTAVYNYEGEAGTLTLEMQCGGEMYIHAVKIVNTAEVNFDSDGDWYFVKAGDAGSLLDVIDVVNGKNAAKDAARSFIYLPNGTYDLDATVKTAITGHNISIIGESMDKTIIVTKPDKSIEGLGKADLFDVSGTNLYMQDLTLKNALDYYNAGSAGRAAVLQDAGNRTIGKNVRMLSYQDTYYSSNNSQQAYWEDCDIHGTVDFICGGGDIRFQNSTISLEPRKADGTGGRTIVAPTTNTNFGYVFDGCTIVDLSEGKGDWNFGRTWQNEPITVYLNTTLDDVAKNTIVSKRWTEKGMNNKDPKVFGEYGTKDASGADITPASNVITSFGGTFETILTAEQAAAFAYEKMFTDWSPASLTAQIDAAILNPVYENGTVSFAELDNGMQGCAIFKNDEFVAIAGRGYAIAIDPAVDKLTVRAVNMMGGFGPAAQVAGTATSIQAINAAMERGEQVIYNLSGQRVNKATKGLYIINGRKVVIK